MYGYNGLDEHKPAQGGRRPWKHFGRTLDDKPLRPAHTDRELVATGIVRDHGQRFQSLSVDRDIGDLGDRGSRARVHFGSADGGDEHHRFGS